MKIFFWFCILSSITLFSQTRIGMQGSVTIPTGYFEDAAEVGFGNTLSFTFPLFTSQLEGVVASGYYHCGFKEDLPDYNFSMSTVPILAGVRYNFTDVDIIPYVGVEGGIYYSFYDVKVDLGLIDKLHEKTKSNNWGFSPYGGFRMNLSPAFDIDVNIKYNRIKTVYIARAFLVVQAGCAIRL